LHPYSLERRRLATSQSIAAELGIGAATVLTYRQRAYARLEISQASAMLDRLLD
jgi:DNA-binding CsgD family transcriptional regulator